MSPCCPPLLSTRSFLMTSTKVRSQVIRTRESSPSLCGTVSALWLMHKPAPSRWLDFRRAQATVTPCISRATMRTGSVTKARWASTADLVSPQASRVGLTPLQQAPSWPSLTALPCSYSHATPTIRTPCSAGWPSPRFALVWRKTFL